MAQRRQVWLWMVIATTAVACGRSTPSVPVVQTGKSSRDVGPAPLPALDAHGQAKMASAYHDIRCMLVGGALPAETLYQDNGFADGTAFGVAFAAEAQRQPEWARHVVADSLARACGGEPLPHAPTPTTAP